MRWSGYASGGGCEVDSPHLGTTGFTDAPKYDSTMGIVDRDICFGESDSAIGIAKNSHAEKIIDEIGHDFPC